jgi:formate-nitrite transporter family protein
MSTPEIVRLKTLVTERDRISGSGSAPVTLLEYGDFECIHCGRAFPVIKQLRTLLGDNLRFVFRHFPIIETHPHSLRAAEAAEAAHEQGQFWPMHDQLFEHQTALEDRDLAHYAKRIGLDVEKFERQMADHVFLRQIEDGYERSLLDEHITGTPTLYFNEVRYTGATDLESLLQAVQNADTEGRIQIPETGHKLRGLLSRFRSGGGE